MYICENCHVQVKTGLSSYKKVVATRKKTYPTQDKIDPKSKKLIRFDHGGTGIETVREIQVCENCAPD